MPPCSFSGRPEPVQLNMDDPEDTHALSQPPLSLSSERFNHLLQKLKDEHEFVLSACGAPMSYLTACPAPVFNGRDDSRSSSKEGANLLVIPTRSQPQGSMGKLESDRAPNSPLLHGSTGFWTDMSLLKMDIYDAWKDDASPLSSMTPSATARLCAVALTRQESESDGMGNGASDGDSCSTAKKQKGRVHPDRFVMNPFNPWRMIWDFFGGIVLSWDLYQVPIDVFDPPDDTMGWKICGYVSCAFWCLDIIANCFVGYFERSGALIIVFRLVVRNYLRTWFALDATMVIFDLLEIFVLSGVSATGSGRIFKAFRFLRISRLLRVVKFASKMPEAILALQEHLDSPFLDPVFSMMEDAMALLFVTHFVACAWFGLGRLPKSGPSWTKNTEIEDREFGYKYLETFRMALTFLCGRNIWIEPANVGEVLFTIIVNLFGLMIFACFVGGVTSRLTKIRDNVEKQSFEMYQLKKYLKDNKASLFLKERVIRYAGYARQRHKKCWRSEQVTLLSLISGPLYVELETEVHQPYLIVCPFFAEYGKICPAAMSQVCFACLTHETLGRADALFHRNRVSNKMYLVKTGVLGYLKLADRMPGDMDRTILARRGHWFCEQSLWMPWVHRSKMRALIETDLMSISYDDFKKTSLCHADAIESCRARATEFLEDMRDLPAACWDLPRELISPEDHVDDPFHKKIENITEVLPVSRHFQQMVHKAEEMSSTLLHDEHLEASHREERPSVHAPVRQFSTRHLFSVSKKSSAR